MVRAREGERKGWRQALTYFHNVMGVVTGVRRSERKPVKGGVSSSFLDGQVQAPLPAWLCSQAHTWLSLEGPQTEGLPRATQQTQRWKKEGGERRRVGLAHLEARRPCGI